MRNMFNHEENQAREEIRGLRALCGGIYDAND